MGDQRRTKILVGVLIVAAFAALARFTIFAGDDSSDTVDEPRDRGSVTVPLATNSTVDPNEIPSASNDIDIYNGRNPFEPAIVIAPSTTPTTSTTTSASGTTTSTVAGATTTTTTVPSNDPNSRMFTLLTVTRQTNGTYIATARIGDTTWPDILEGTTFGPGNTYRFLRGTNDNCGTFQHGDTTFDLCENSSTLK